MLYKNRLDVIQTQHLFERVFDSELELKTSIASDSRKGWYKLKYFYPPDKYEIVFESENSCFNIRVLKNDLFTSLQQILPHDNELNEMNVLHALTELKRILHQPIYFYRRSNNHLYQEVQGGKFK
jgi:hypothetical protein